VDVYIDDDNNHEKDKEPEAEKPIEKVAV